MLKLKTKQNKSLAIIDYANIKSWLRDKNLLIDLKVLKQVLNEIGIEDVRFYYGVDSKNFKIKKFFEVIEKFGFILVSKPVQYFKIKLSTLIKQKNNQRLIKKLSEKLQGSFLTEIENLEKTNLIFLQPKANFDVEITIDALERIDEYDNFILFSGDGDFVPLIEKIQENGKQVVVLSGRKYFSGLLRKKSNIAVSMELLIKILPELVSQKMQKPADKRQVFKKCILSIATKKRLSSLFGVIMDKPRKCKN